MNKRAQESVRVSASTLSNIRDPEGRYALLLNKNAAQRGEKILTPLGGAVEVTPAGKLALKNMLSLRDEDFEKNNDIRLKNVPSNTLDAFVQWFTSRTDRELTPLRELSEEIIDESGILHQGALVGSWYRFLGYGSERAISGRSGTETVRVGDVYEVGLSNTAMRIVMEHAAEPESALVFVTHEEIMQEQADNGMRIASVSQFLVNHAADIDIHR